MVIVDTFTKLIFEQDCDFSPAEEDIIEAFRLVDDNVEFDSLQDMGGYLRALGVREMIELVTLVRERLEQNVPALTKRALHRRDAGRQVH